MASQTYLTPATKLTTRPTRGERTPLTVRAATAPPEFAPALLGSELGGLPEAEARRRRQRVGPNVVRARRAPAPLTQFLVALGNPFVLILFGLAAVLLVTEVLLADPELGPSWGSPALVSGIALLSAALRFWQEYRSRLAAGRIAALVTTTSTVTRQLHGVPVTGERPNADLVPGDIVELAAGDLVPADVRILRSDGLHVNQSMHTGEALPARKSADALPVPGDPLRARNLAFMGSYVVSGTATVLVLATGDATSFGGLAALSQRAKPATAFDIGIRRVSWTLIRFMGVLVPAVFLVNGLTNDWDSALLFAVATAVGLTPEMLPLVVTVNLAKGARHLARERVVVKRLAAIHDLGAMEVLFVDKTGTLTTDAVTLTHCVNTEGAASDRVLGWAGVHAYFRTGLRDALDSAVLEATGDDLDRTIAGRESIAELPFDFTRRRNTVVVREHASLHVLVTQGAPEELLELSEWELAGGTQVRLTPARRTAIAELIAAQQARGLRTLGVAIRDIPVAGPMSSAIEYTVADEVQLTFVGLLGFTDPPKPTARRAIRSLAARGVTVKIITGDSPEAARALAASVGIRAGNAVLGTETDRLTLAELGDLAASADVFARVAPAQKARIIEAVRERGSTVGYLGDGLNDAPALAAADVGIAVDSAVDIAQDAADLVLLEQDLTVLERGVIEGRRTFANTVNYVKITASSNLGNVLAVLLASALLPFPPMIPVVVLAHNIAYDVAMLTLAWDRVDGEQLRAPRRWDERGIVRFMLRFGPISAVFDLAMFAVLWWGLGATGPERVVLFQSGWFVLSLVSQTLIVHLLRTRVPLRHAGRAGIPVVVATGLVCSVALLLPVTVLGGALGLVPLPWNYYPWLLGILLCYCAAIELAKRRFISRTGSWL